jgi:hypothetical protein
MNSMPRPVELSSVAIAAKIRVLFFIRKLPTQDQVTPTQPHRNLVDGVRKPRVPKLVITSEQTLDLRLSYFNRRVLSATSCSVGLLQDLP